MDSLLSTHPGDINFVNVGDIWVACNCRKPYVQRIALISQHDQILKTQSEQTVLGLMLTLYKMNEYSPEHFKIKKLYEQSQS